MEGKVFTIDGKHIRVVVSVQDGLHEMDNFNRHSLHYAGYGASLKEHPEPYISVGFEVGELEGEDFIKNNAESSIYDFAIVHEDDPVELPNLPAWASSIKTSLIEDADRLICDVYGEFEELIEKVNS